MPRLLPVTRTNSTPEITRPDPGKVISGDPVHTTWNVEDRGQVFAGLWHSTPGKWRVSYDEWEYFRLLEGVSVITDAAGHATTLGAGDAWIIRPGFTGTWEVLDATLKDYVIVVYGVLARQTRRRGAAQKPEDSMKKLVCAIALFLPTASPGFAQNVVAADPASMTEVLQSFGYRAELGTDSGGDPKISSSSGGANFSIFFYGCTNGTRCDAISFSSAFDLDPGSNNDLMNKWNQKKRYTKAYLDDEQDPVIDMDVYLGDGGVSIDNFRTWVDTWERAIGDFKVHIDF